MPRPEVFSLANCSSDGVDFENGMVITTCWRHRQVFNQHMYVPISTTALASEALPMCSSEQRVFVPCPHICMTIICIRSGNVQSAFILAEGQFSLRQRGRYPSEACLLYQWIINLQVSFKVFNQLKKTSCCFYQVAIGEQTLICAAQYRNEG